MHSCQIKHCKLASAFIIVMIAILNTGCATYSLSEAPHDPWENYNRSIHSFNDKLDRYALKPVATGYHAVTPDFIETGIHNFFNNIDDVTVIINDLLQGKLIQSAQDTGRLLLNTTIGIAGLFDVASPLGLPKHYEDFGQTLGKWGVAEGPYFVLPLLGPATIRSSAGRIGDIPMDPISYVIPTSAGLSLTAVELLDTRVQFLAASDLLDSVFDPYAFMRDAYILNRRKLAYDNNEVDQSEVDELEMLEDTDELDSLDELDELDSLDELDELDRLELPTTPEKDELDLLDELDL